MQPPERNRSAYTVQRGAASSGWHINPPRIPEKARRLEQLAVQDHRKIDKLWSIPWRLMGLSAGSLVGNARTKAVPLKHSCSSAALQAIKHRTWQHRHMVPSPTLSQQCAEWSGFLGREILNCYKHFAKRLGQGVCQAQLVWGRRWGTCSSQDHDCPGSIIHAYPSLTFLQAKSLHTLKNVNSALKEYNQLDQRNCQPELNTITWFLVMAKTRCVQGGLRGDCRRPGFVRIM